MGERFVFNSPSVKFKEKDLTYYRKPKNRSQVITVGTSVGGGGTTPPVDSNLQWVTGFMYNTGVLMYNYKIWNNN